MDFAIEQSSTEPRLHLDLKYSRREYLEGLTRYCKRKSWLDLNKVSGARKVNWRIAQAAREIKELDDKKPSRFALRPLKCFKCALARHGPRCVPKCAFHYGGMYKNTYPTFAYSGILSLLLARECDWSSLLFRKKLYLLHIVLSLTQLNTKWLWNGAYYNPDLTVGGRAFTRFGMG
ncbi:unnamed protein product [Ilex paraguariensis]|uniref:Uncharacterized protein n=1 Tax=Ilex paraguariensis TaxID=185542 RepID=A0ABC8TJ82_9AQUA